MTETQNQETPLFDPKKAFLDAFKELGFRNKACKKADVKSTTVSYWLKTDPEFQLTYQIWDDHWKELRKEKLEVVMYETGLTPGGHRDRMKWLEKNYPAEYNPKMVKEDEKSHEGVIKNLLKKTEGYKHGKSGNGNPKAADSGAE